MSNLGEGIREKAEINTKTEIIINLMDSMKISAEESMKLIKIKPEEYEAYRSRVEDMVLRSKWALLYPRSMINSKS